MDTRFSPAFLRVSLLWIKPHYQPYFQKKKRLRSPHFVMIMYKEGIKSVTLWFGSVSKGFGRAPCPPNWQEVCMNKK